MNYFEHHIGDYAEATAHLSFVEDAAYSRLIRKYYATEKPLPAEISQVQRLVGARTKDEREAVATVLEEFFDLQVDGWHNARCDEEIEKMRRRIGAAKENGKHGGRPKKAGLGYENKTQQKPEETHWVSAGLNEELDEKLVKSGNFPNDEGESEKNFQNDDASEKSYPHPPEKEKSEINQRQDKPSGFSLGYENKTQQKPNQKLSIHHTPELKPISESSVNGGNSPPYPPQPAENATSRKGELCRKLRALGIDTAPHLAAWAEILPHFSDEEILAAAEASREKKPGERIHLNYLVPVLRDRSPPKKNTDPPWWSSEPLILEKGRSLGLTPKAGEDWGSFKGRIHARLRPDDGAEASPATAPETTHRI